MVRLSKESHWSIIKLTNLFKDENQKFTRCPASGKNKYLLRFGKNKNKRIEISQPVCSSKQKHLSCHKCFLIRATKVIKTLGKSCQ